MNGKVQYKSGKDICISVFLIVTMILRLMTENTNLFAIFALISFVVAVYDIYVSVEERYGHYGRRFLIVRGAFIVGAAIGAVAVAITAIFKCNISTLVVDELSILALLASLPKELFCRLLGNYIHRNEGNKL